MRRKFFTIILTLLIEIGFVGVAKADEILVAAAASLTDVLKEISADYQSKNAHKISFVFGPSSDLARQIEEGAPADMFFSADLLQMDELDKKRPSGAGHAEEPTCRINW